ncbi:MAG: hypothetical protein CVV42_05570 [Candidatus Riflebacteria bacterium HGW-Riflebacteria-2]|jgi:hypothetical protein|nr:MAG: hypothetical protein CVV42_05570 [Candidatus Riflebacteria bacterium HGW-Riflebacteria-2]
MANRYQILLLTLVLLFGVAVCASEKVDLDKIDFPAPRLGKTPVKDQLQLAYSLYDQMSATDIWDVESFRDCHNRVINECPDTPWAIESCWRLSNLLITAPRQHDNEEVVRLMTHALEKYPGNPWQDRFKNRLLRTLQDMKDHTRLLYWCQKLLETTDPESEKYLSLTLVAGKSATALGDQESASWYFNEILNRDPKKETIFARIAASHLKQ